MTKYATRTEADLRPSQRALLEEITTVAQGIVELGMGGGKTATALTAHARLAAAGEIDCSIVLAPARVVDNVWPAEPAKWEHLQHLDVVAVVGTPKQRARIMAEKHDVYVVSIDNAKWLVEVLKGRDLGRTQLFIDEISRMKDPRSVRGKALFEVSNRFAGVWGMTGTPRPNGYEDLWMPIRIVSGDRAVWGSWQKERNGMRSTATDFDTWRERHFYKVDHAGHRWEPHAFMQPTLDTVAAHWIVRAPVTDLVKPKLNTGDDFVRWVHATEEQTARYEEMMAKLITAGRERGLAGEVLIDWVVEACSQGVASGKLTQIAQGFVYLKEEDRTAYRFAENPKLDMLAEMDEDLGGDRAVICYGFVEEIAMIEERLKHRTMARIGGGVSTAKAKAIIDAWNRKEIDRLLIHPASAGHGIELQFGGSQMIWYHPTWSSELNDQTIKRLDRPGQTAEVFDWKIAMKETNDEIKLARVWNKTLDEAAFKGRLRSLVG